MATISTHEPERLVKHHLADVLRSAIMSGALRPGERVVEGKWASKSGVAQGSIREAINLLALEGFVTKQSGRSARVVHFSERDAERIYEIREAFEGLGGSLAIS